MRLKRLELLRGSFAKKTCVARWAILFAAALAFSYAQPLFAQTYTVIHNFTGAPDGTYPYSGLTTDRAGNLYGTTMRGGFAGSIQCGYEGGCGTVYRLSRTSNGWSNTVLYAFKGQPVDGAGPISRVIFGPDGALYGTTQVGGRGLSVPCSACLLQLNLAVTRPVRGRRATIVFPPTI